MILWDCIRNKWGRTYKPLRTYLSYRTLRKGWLFLILGFTTTGLWFAYLRYLTEYISLSSVFFLRGAHGFYIPQLPWCLKMSTSSLSLSHFEVDLVFLAHSSYDLKLLAHYYFIFSHCMLLGENSKSGWLSPI